MTAQDIRMKEFKVMKRRGGYEREDVDIFLDRAAAAYDGLEKALQDTQQENAQLRVQLHDLETAARMPKIQPDPADTARIAALEAQVRALDADRAQLEQQVSDLQSAAQNVPAEKPLGVCTLADEIQAQQLVLAQLEKARVQVEEQATRADEYAASTLREGRDIIQDARRVIDSTLDDIEAFRAALESVIQGDGVRILDQIDALHGMQNVLNTLERGADKLEERAAGYTGRSHEKLTKPAGAEKRTSRKSRSRNTAARSSRSTTKTEPDRTLEPEKGDRAAAPERVDTLTAEDVR